jgi:hypothetical protein
MASGALLSAKQIPKSEYAVTMGRLGGLARAAVLPPERRLAIARKAIQARWDKRKNKDMDEPNAQEAAPASVEENTQPATSEPATDRGDDSPGFYIF